MLNRARLLSSLLLLLTIAVVGCDDNRRAKLVDEHLTRAEELQKLGDSKAAYALLSADWPSRELLKPERATRFDELYRETAYAVIADHLDVGDVPNALEVRESLLQRYPTDKPAAADRWFEMVQARARPAEGEPLHYWVYEALMVIGDPRFGAGDDGDDGDAPDWADAYDAMFAETLARALIDEAYVDREAPLEWLYDRAPDLLAIDPDARDALIAITIETASDAVGMGRIAVAWALYTLAMTMRTELLGAASTDPDPALTRVESALIEIDMARAASIEAQRNLPQIRALEAEIANRPHAETSLRGLAQHVRTVANRLAERTVGIRTNLVIAPSWQRSGHASPPTPEPILDRFIDDVLPRWGYSYAADGLYTLTIEVNDAMDSMSVALGHARGAGTILSALVVLQWAHAEDIPPPIDEGRDAAERAWMNDHPLLWQRYLKARSNPGSEALYDMPDPTRQSIEALLWREAARELSRKLARMRFPLAGSMQAVAQSGGESGDGEGDGDGEGEGESAPVDFALVTAPPPLVPAIWIESIEPNTRGDTPGGAITVYVEDDPEGRRVAVGETFTDAAGRQVRLVSVGDGHALAFDLQDGDQWKRVWADVDLLTARNLYPR